MPANVDGMVREGVSAYRAGRKEEARTLLMRAVEIDQYNEQAWLWLSAVVESVEEQRTCLENVITINPNNDRAKQGLQLLDQKLGSKGPSTGAQADDLLAGSSFTPTSGQAANPFNAQIDEELPTSIEWEASASSTPTSSPSSQAPVKEPSPAEYDDWVSNLNLGGGNGGNNTLPSDAEKLLAMTDDEADDSDDLFDLNKTLGIGEDTADDLFASGPFSAPQTPIPEEPQPPSRSQPAPSRLSAIAGQSKKNSADALLDTIEDEDDDAVGSAFVDDFDDAAMEKVDASEFFRYIPREIVATRLPGTSERYPILAVLGLLLFVGLNIGAVAFFVGRMIAR